MSDGLRFMLIGNLSAEFSTENEWRKAAEALGWDVLCFQEEDAYQWDLACRIVGMVDLVAWVRTRSLAQPHDTQRRLIDACHDKGVPLIGLHLDRWLGLAREAELAGEPYFAGVDMLFTADGANPGRWAEYGINHHWLPPAVGEAECAPGTARGEYRTPVAFVGSHDGGYHPEAQHRHALVDFLRREYGDRCAFWPKPGEHAVRGPALRDLYASCTLTVGDSCYLPGETPRVYSSDRLFEAPGRGACLAHPAVEGMTDGSLLTSGEHLLTWPLGDWSTLGDTIGWALAHPDECAAIGANAMQHIRGHHTYRHRLTEAARVLGLEP